MALNLLRKWNETSEKYATKFINAVGVSIKGGNGDARNSGSGSGGSKASVHENVSSSKATHSVPRAKQISKTKPVIAPYTAHNNNSSSSSNNNSNGNGNRPVRAAAVASIAATSQSTLSSILKSAWKYLTDLDIYNIFTEPVRTVLCII